MQHPTAALSVLAALLAVPGHAQTPTWIEPVKKTVDDHRQSSGAPGLSVAVGVAGDVVLATGFGLADIENDVPATGDTVYRLASISKPVTAVCALRLVEQGKLDLDRPVAEFVPAWPKKRWPVTSRQLLCHLGGVRHYLPDEGESTVHYRGQTAALVRFADHRLLHEPGTKYIYSTFGYNLAAAAIEQAAGKPFFDVVLELVAQPSGAASLQDDNVRRIIRGRAQGYVRRGGELQNSVLMDSSYKLGGGGLCSSVGDLARFGMALIDGELVSKSSLQAMWTPQRTTGGEQLTYGLGFRIGERAGRREVSHSGAQSRVSTILYMLPDERVVVVLMCNLERVRLASLAQEVADLVLR